MQENRKARIELGTLHFQEANEQVRAALAEADMVELQDVFAQRYLGCAMPTGKRLEIHGTPGNDMASYMDGGQIEVFGNVQDQIGNTMNEGLIVVHGRCGDAAGYAMRGGSIFIRDDCGWRVGINMKQYEAKRPAIFIGGNAGNFLGEYMAGGIIVLLGRPGKYLASGMHGGVIYLAHRLPDEEIAPGLMQEVVSDDDIQLLQGLIDSYRAYFSDDGELPSIPQASAFWKVTPQSARPYASMYAH